MAFEDIFQQIVKYYSSLGEPLLTNELSYLFLHVLELLLYIRQPIKPKTVTVDETSRDKTTTLSREDASKQHSSLILIEELIDNLRSQLKEKGEKFLLSACVGDDDRSKKATMTMETTQKLMSLITNRDKAKLLNSKIANPVNETFENVESKLIDDANLPIWFLLENAPDDDASHCGGLSFINNLSSCLTGSSDLKLSFEQKEVWNKFYTYC